MSGANKKVRKYAARTLAMGTELEIAGKTVRTLEAKVERLEAERERLAKSLEEYRTACNWVSRIYASKPTRLISAEEVCCMQFLETTIERDARRRPVAEAERAVEG